MLTVLSWFLSIGGCAAIFWALLGGIMSIYQRITNPVIRALRVFLWTRFFKFILIGAVMIIMSAIINKFLV